MKNDQHLKDILKSPSDNGSYIVHLVCTQKSNDFLRKRQVNGNNTNNNNNINNNYESVRFERLNNETATSNESALISSTNNSLGNNYLMPTSSYPLATLNSETLSTMPMLFQSGLINPDQFVQQMAVLEQMYAQYMAQYLNQPVFVSPNATTTNSVNSNLTAPEITHQPPLQEQAPVQPPRVRPPEEEEEDVHNRDWLDWLYWFSRASIIFSIIYFYSTLSRFIIVIGLAILIHLYKIGMFNFVNHRNNDQAAEREAPIPVNPPENHINPQEARNHEIHRESRDDETNESIDLASIHPINTSPSKLKLIWVLVSGFFLSLIPEHPPPINVN